MTGQEKLIQNVKDQIKEAQIKLGYVEETVRLYYPAASLNLLLGINAESAEELKTFLETEPAFSDTGLGKLHFAVCDGRIELSVSPKGVEYVHREVENPAFLTELITFFQNHHTCTKEEICPLFCKYDKDYVCEKMPEGMDFDYVVYFRDGKVDPYYYCMKEEMGHTVYHRFMKEDYLELLRS